MNHTDEQLIQAYSQEVFGSLYDPEKPLTIEQLIEHSRQWRKSNADTCDKRKQGYNDGYDRGYSVGLSRAARNTIPLNTLREMTVYKLCELFEREQ